MASLIFLLCVLTLIILLISSVVRLTRRKPARRPLYAMAFVVAGYTVAWGAFKLSQKRVATPLGTQVCFDDWCATVQRSERQVAGDSLIVTLHLEMFNNARGIAQTPSEPRVHLLDATGKMWTFSPRQQSAYEKLHGRQPGITHRLELHQSMATVLVFAVPKNEEGLMGLIEEGPWITGLLFPEDQQVFAVE